MATERNFQHSAKYVKGKDPICKMRTLLMEKSASTSLSVSFEATPNPATMKFNLGRRFQEESLECKNVQEAHASPLAMKIFGFPWTSSVFVGPDYVAVTKQDWVEWNILAKPLAGLIQEHLERGEPLLVKIEAAPPTSDDELESDSPTVRTLKRILKNQIKPVVNLDGGDVSFVKYENSVLFIQMKGACVGCPSSAATLKDGIEVQIRQLVPEVTSVVSV